MRNSFPYLDDDNEISQDAPGGGGMEQSARGGQASAVQGHHDSLDNHFSLLDDSIPPCCDSVTKYPCLALLLPKIRLDELVPGDTLSVSDSGVVN